MSDPNCICGDMPPGGVWPRGEEPPRGCPVHDTPEWRAHVELVRSCDAIRDSLPIDSPSSRERIREEAEKIAGEFVAEQQGDNLMSEAWDLTTRDRNNQYGNAVDAFRAYGHIWTGLLAHKLKDDAVIDATDVTLMMTGLKIAREVRSPKRDNVVDAHGYLSLLSRIRGWIKV